MDKIPKLDGGGHVEHHAETYDDMQLKVDDEAWMRSAPAQVCCSCPRISLRNDASIALIVFPVRWVPVLLCASVKSLKSDALLAVASCSASTMISGVALPSPGR